MGGRAADVCVCVCGGGGGGGGGRTFKAHEVAPCVLNIQIPQPLQIQRVSMGVGVPFLCPWRFSIPFGGAQVFQILHLWSTGQPCKTIHVDCMDS